MIKGITVCFHLSVMIETCLPDEHGTRLGGGGEPSRTWCNWGFDEEIGMILESSGRLKPRNTHQTPNNKGYAGI